MKVLFVILALSTSAQAQIGIGHSVPLWGKTIETAEISFQVDRFSLHYFWNYTEYPEHVKCTYRFLCKLDPEPIKRTSTIAFSYKILDKKYFGFSPAYTLNNFPTPNASKVNFIIEFKLPINDILLIKYKHLSNGFGLMNKENVGYDSLSISIEI